MSAHLLARTRRIAIQRRVHTCQPPPNATPIEHSVQDVTELGKVIPYVASERKGHAHLKIELQSLRGSFAKTAVTLANIIDFGWIMLRQPDDTST